MHLKSERATYFNNKLLNMYLLLVRYQVQSRAAKLHYDIKTLPCAYAYMHARAVIIMTRTYARGK